MRIDPCLIDQPLEHIDLSIFDRGYSYADDEGIWYEVYVTNKIKSWFPNSNVLYSDEGNGLLSKFADVLICHFEEDNQITFFVPSDEKIFGLMGLTKLLNDYKNHINQCSRCHINLTKFEIELNTSLPINKPICIRCEREMQREIIKKLSESTAEDLNFYDT